MVIVNPCVSSYITFQFTCIEYKIRVYREMNRVSITTNTVNNTFYTHNIKLCIYGAACAWELVISTLAGLYIIQ